MMPEKSKVKRKKSKGKAFLNYALFVLLTLLISSRDLIAKQPQPTPVKKSEKVETIDGKKYYIHSVSKGQTLYSIAKTYGTTVDIVLSNNPNAIDGLKSGDKLKIPYSGNTEAIKKEIDKQSAHTPVKEKTPKADTVQKHSPNPVHAVGSLFEKKDTAVKPIENIQVAAFLPLSLSAVRDINVDKIAQGEEKLPDEIKIGVEFYEGMKIAFDTLKKQGFKGYLHVYDSNADSAGLAKLLSAPEMKEMNLFIGPLYGRKFETVLKFAKENNIDIVSPTLQGNNILLGNPNVSKVTPSFAVQSEELATFTAEKYADYNILIFNSGSPKDRPYINVFKKTANPLLAGHHADSVKEITFTTLKDFIVPAVTIPQKPNPNKNIVTRPVVDAKATKGNLIALLSTNSSFITEAVNKLFLYKQETNDSLIVMSMSNFQDIESLDFGYLNTLHAIATCYEFVDYSNPQTKKFILRYRNEYKTEPTQYVYLGYDVCYFYLKGLQRYGHSLEARLPELKQKGMQTEFNFFQSDLSSGYENRGMGIMKFENFNYIRIR